MELSWDLGFGKYEVQYLSGGVSCQGGKIHASTDKIIFSHQVETLAKQATYIRAFMGYARRYHNKTMAELTLWLYRDRQCLLTFVAYLMARDVGADHIIKHLSIARRASMFLDAVNGTAQTRHQQREFEATWFRNLEGQLRLAIPRRPMAEMPPANILFAWVEHLVQAARRLLAWDAGRLGGGRIGPLTAWVIQIAIIAMLVCGSHVPPCRISAIKSLRHPNKITDGSCPDPDCLHRAGTCRGNRFEVIEEEQEQEPEEEEEEGHEVVRRVRFVAPHHKNTWRGAQPIDFMIPLGDLSDFLLIHNDQGHDLITEAENMFASGSGAKFNDSTFCTFFRSTCLKGAPFPPFPPSWARHIFVQEYCGVFGEDPDMWDGASTVRNAPRLYDSPQLDLTRVLVLKHPPPAWLMLIGLSSCL